jgi:hypothetical protein
VIHFAQHVNNSVDEKLSSWDFLGTDPIRPWTEPVFPGRAAAGCTPIQQTDKAADLRHGCLCTAFTDAMVTTNSHLSITTTNVQLGTRLWTMLRLTRLSDRRGKMSCEHSGRGW